MNLIHRSRVARFAAAPQNPSTLRSPFPRGEGIFAFSSGAGVSGTYPVTDAKTKTKIPEKVLLGV